MKTKLTTAIFSVCLLGACMTMPSGNRQVPEPAKSVELNRYLGRWYELARYENSFEKGCEGVTADYSLRSDGKIKVLNSCREGSPTGRLRSSEGKAKIVEGSRNAKLKVSFFGPFYGNYWVLDRANDYSWSIVGEPSGKYLWVLHRKPKISEVERAGLYQRVRELGYDLNLLRETAQ